MIRMIIHLQSLLNTVTIMYKNYYQRLQKVVNGWGHDLIHVHPLFLLFSNLDKTDLRVQCWFSGTYPPPLLCNQTANDGGILPDSCLLVPEFLQPQHALNFLSH